MEERAAYSGRGEASRCCRLREIDLEWFRGLSSCNEEEDVGFMRRMSSNEGQMRYVG